MKPKELNKMPSQTLVTDYFSSHEEIEATQNDFLRVITKTTDTDPCWQARVDYGLKGHKKEVTTTMLSVSTMLRNIEKLIEEHAVANKR